MCIQSSWLEPEAIHSYDFVDDQSIVSTIMAQGAHHKIDDAALLIDLLGHGSLSMPVKEAMAFSTESLIAGLIYIENCYELVALRALVQKWLHHFRLVSSLARVEEALSFIACSHSLKSKLRLALERFGDGSEFAVAPLLLYLAATEFSSFSFMKRGLLKALRQGLESKDPSGMNASNHIANLSRALETIFVCLILNHLEEDFFLWLPQIEMEGWTRSIQDFLVANVASLIGDDDRFRLLQTTVSKLQVLVKGKLAEAVGTKVAQLVNRPEPVASNKNFDRSLFGDLSQEADAAALIKLLSRQLMCSESSGFLESDRVCFFIRSPGVVHSMLQGKNASVLLHLFAGLDPECFDKIYGCLSAYRSIFIGNEVLYSAGSPNYIHREIILAIYLVSLASGLSPLLVSWRLRALLSSQIEDLSTQEMLEPFLLLLASYVDLSSNEQVAFFTNLNKALEIYTGKQEFFPSIIEDSLPGVILFISGTASSANADGDAMPAWTTSELQMLLVVSILLENRDSGSREEVMRLLVSTNHTSMFSC